MWKILNKTSEVIFHGGPATDVGTKKVQSYRAWLLAAGEKICCRPISQLAFEH